MRLDRRHKQAITRPLPQDELVQLQRLLAEACGERIAARHPESQTAEIRIRVARINRSSALGSAEIVRVG
jgi:hypothetical protein